MTTQTAPRFASLPSLSTTARHAARVLLGGLFAFASVSYFLNLMPPPTEPLPDAVAAFTGGLRAAGYMFPLIKGTELVGALLLLSNRFVPLALALLAPVVVNSVAFHVALAPAGLPMALALLVLEVGLALAYRDAYRSMLMAR